MNEHAILNMFHGSEEGLKHVHYFAAMPCELVPYIPGFWWNEERLFNIDAVPIETKTENLKQFLKVPIWRGTAQSGLFSTTGANILECPSTFKDHWKRVIAADLSCPIALYRKEGRIIILDGYHRLVKAFHEGMEQIPAKLLNSDQIETSLEMTGFLGELNRLSQSDPRFVSNARRIAIELLESDHAEVYPPWR